MMGDVVRIVKDPVPDDGGEDGGGMLTVSMDTLVLAAAMVASGCMVDETEDMHQAFLNGVTAVKTALNDLDIYVVAVEVGIDEG